MLQHRSGLWHVKNTAKKRNINKSKVGKFLHSESDPAYVLASDRIRAVNRKTRDLSSKIGSEEPRKKPEYGHPKPKSAGNKNSDFFGNKSGSECRIKVAKRLLGQRLEPPESAYSIPNFGDQEECVFRTLAPNKIAQRFSYIRLNSFKPENFVAIARSLFEI